MPTATTRRIDIDHPRFTGRASIGCITRVSLRQRGGDLTSEAWTLDKLFVGTDAQEQREHTGVDQRL